VDYQNGDNDHTVKVVLPIELGSDKTIAVPVLNNVELSSKGAYYDITGDITNAGISDAKGVVVTVGDPAVPAGTYPEYGIGSIASDDSGSFEVTFSARNLSAIPVVITWKDSAGNNYKITKTVDLSNSAGASIESDGSSTGSVGQSAAAGQEPVWRSVSGRHEPQQLQPQFPLDLLRKRPWYQLVLSPDRSRYHRSRLHCPVHQAEMGPFEDKKTAVRGAA